MSSRLNPYLTFDGNARQAMEFYASVFGGNLVLNAWASSALRTHRTPTASGTRGWRPTLDTQSWLATSPATCNTSPWQAAR